jgi:predicted AlkP superfamily pyrophosphatase or phosphodiesterase
MRPISQVDIAPTIAGVLGITIPQLDGRTIKEVTSWIWKNAVLIIVDSLGMDLYRQL